MKPHALNLLAALALVGLPASLPAATPASAPVELHIEASIQVPPDRAIVPITLSASGPTQAEAEAELKRREEAFMAEFASAGIGRDNVGARAGKGGPDANPVVTIVSNEGAVDAASSAAEAAEGTADQASGRPVRRSKRAASPKIDPVVLASKTVMVEIDDLSKFPMLESRAGEFGDGSRLRPIFSASDPAAARSKAREQALAKARKDADEYAAAMGYRVVRIVRISTAKPPVNMQDIVDFVGMMDSRSPLMQPSYFTATVFETVAIDYAIVPK